jgi:hypothetical protein
VTTAAAALSHHQVSVLANRLESTDTNAAGSGQLAPLGE